MCWELSPKIKDGSVLSNSAEPSKRMLKITPKEEGKLRSIVLDSDDASIKIRVICLKEYIEDSLKIQLLDQ